MADYLDKYRNELESISQGNLESFEYLLNIFLNTDEDIVVKIKMLYYLEEFCSRVESNDAHYPDPTEFRKKHSFYDMLSESGYLRSFSDIFVIGIWNLIQSFHREGQLGSNEAQNAVKEIKEGLGKNSYFDEIWFYPFSKIILKSLKQGNDEIILFILNTFGQYNYVTIHHHWLFDSYPVFDEVFNEIYTKYIKSLGYRTDEIDVAILNSLNRFFPFINEDVLLYVCWFSFNHSNREIQKACLDFLKERIEISTNSSEYHRNQDYHKNQGLLILHIIKEFYSRKIIEDETISRYAFEIVRELHELINKEVNRFSFSNYKRKDCVAQIFLGVTEKIVSQIQEEQINPEEYKKKQIENIHSNPYFLHTENYSYIFSRTTTEMYRKRDDQKFYKVLINLDSEDIKKRREATNLIADMKDPRAFEALVKSLTDEEPEVRSNAARGLGALKDIRSIKPLIKALKDKDKWTRKHARIALIDIGEQAKELLQEALENDNEDIRSSVVHILKVLKDKKEYSRN